MADNGAASDHLNSVILALPLLVLGAVAAWVSLADLSAFGNYTAFFAALALWGGIELAFLSGVITGPNRRICPSAASPADRFWRAVGTIAWHEALLVSALVILGAISWQAANPFALATFALLFLARLSARLNLFFGVPRINTQFLPRLLAHLASHFRVARITAFFPLSVSAMTVASALVLERAVHVQAPGPALGYALLTCLSPLAVLERWFMVLPLPDEKLWRWRLPAPKQLALARVAFIWFPILRRGRNFGIGGLGIGSQTSPASLRRA